MKLAKARELAEEAMEKLVPVCERISIAGSIRRECANVKDVELVVIPAKVPGGLWGDIPEVDPRFYKTVDQWTRIRGHAQGKYTQRLLRGMLRLDLFMACPMNWGLILAIRTGSAAFSHKVLAKRWCREGLMSDEGMLRRRETGEIIPVREERQLFHMIGMDWIHPRDRNMR